MNRTFSKSAVFFGTIFLLMVAVVFFSCSKNGTDITEAFFNGTFNQTSISVSLATLDGEKQLHITDVDETACFANLLRRHNFKKFFPDKTTPVVKQGFEVCIEFKNKQTTSGLVVYTCKNVKNAFYVAYFTKATGGDRFVEAIVIEKEEIPSDLLGKLKGIGFITQGWTPN
jgi:hypothetical protein